MAIHEIIVPKTGRYCTYGNKNTAQRFWFCCHGYGQLAPYFIKNFEGLDPEANFVVCPEGLHRFYLRDSAGRVGASWMTKESRETDISDYLSYLDRVHLDSGLGDHPEIPLIAFGFSQGVATIARWIGHTESPISIAIFWAGAFPPDLNPIELQTKFKEIQAYCFIGDKDEYIGAPEIEKAKVHYAAIGLSPEWKVFSGGHVIIKEELQRIKW
jgi:predicted esterase